MSLKLFNTLTGEKENFVSIKPGIVGMYNCGPTVYDYAHIGNLRAYIFADTLKRVLEWNNYKVKQVINITDVGHLVGDLDLGEDKVEQAAKQKEKTAEEISRYYEKEFLKDLKNLNINTKDIEFPRATKTIKDQIKLIQILEKKGFTYKTFDGIYFNTAEFKKYGKLGNINLKGLEEGVRVEKNPEKKNPTDFALWKFSRKNEKRQQEWDSPWGIGFPGWSIECSAMSMKILGETFDIHTGGIDHIPVHHNNEIAQSECATGKKYVNYWLHNAYLIIDGKRMGKSKGNLIKLDDLIKARVHPLSYRYLVLGAHYKTTLNINIQAIINAQNSFESVLNEIRLLINESKIDTEKNDNSLFLENYINEFNNYVNDDLDTAKAISLIHKLIKEDTPSDKKVATILKFDQVFGLNLFTLAKKLNEIPEDIVELANERESARQNKEWEKSDKIRKSLEEKGFVIKDSDKNSNGKTIIERKLFSLLFPY